MLSNHPTVRAVLYVAAIVAQVASIVTRIWFPEVADALQAVAVFLGGLIGVQALTNLTPTYVTVEGEAVGKHVRENGLDG